MKSNMELILVRGTPGAGKSTLAKKLVKESYDVDSEQPLLRHIEADMFWELKDGTYRFEREKLSLAHQYCQSKTAQYFQQGFSVIVSNTFTQLRELTPYIELANIYGASIKVIECKKQYGSIHNVPEATVQAMLKRWEDIPEDWIGSIIKEKVCLSNMV